jgi:hypothetical protein
MTKIYSHTTNSASKRLNLSTFKNLFMTKLFICSNNDFFGNTVILFVLIVRLADRDTDRLKQNTPLLYKFAPTFTRLEETTLIMWCFSNRAQVEPSL